MKQRFYFLLILLFFAGCKKSENANNDTLSAVVIETSIAAPTRAGVGAGTRVDEGSHNFIKNDKIELFMTEASKELESSGNQIDRLIFRYDGTTWIGNLTKASLVGTTFKAYGCSGIAYPNNARAVKYNIQAPDLKFGIRPPDYLLYGKSTSVITVDKDSNAPTVIPLSFTNCLTRVVVEITTPTTYNGKVVRGIERVHLMQQPKTCNLDLATGALSYDIYADKLDIGMYKSPAGYYECLTIPNTVAAGEAYLRVRLNYTDNSWEYVYCYAPAEGIVFAGNEVHTLLISCNELSCYTNFFFGAAGGTIPADIRTNMSQEYTLKSNNSWLTVTGNKNVTTAALNGSLQPRTGSLTLSNGVVSRDIAVLQEPTVTIAGTRWLTTNLTGAAGTNSGHAICDAPQDYGTFFKWGDTWVYQCASSSTDGMAGGNVGNASTAPAASGTGSFGYDYGLGLSGGRASGDLCQKLGSSYRTPTCQQYIDLVASGASAWTTYNGVNGYFFGPNAAQCDNITIAPGCLFFPACGHRNWGDGVHYGGDGSDGNYLASSVVDSTNIRALIFSNSRIFSDGVAVRAYGFSVRCVQE